MAIGCDDNENGDNGEDEKDDDDGFLFSLVI